MPRNQQLYDSTKAYVVAGLELLRNRPRVLYVDDSETHWVREGEHFIRRAVTPEPVASVSTHRDDLRTLPEYGALVGELASDPVIAAQVGPLVGTAFGFQRIRLEEVADSVLIALTTNSRDLALDEEVFDRAYVEMEDWFYADRLGYVLVAPIAGLESETLPITLEESVAEIARLDDHEIVRCITSGVLRPLGGDWPLIPASNLAGLRWNFELVKQALAEEQGTDSMREDATEIFQRMGDEVDRVVLALRLLKAGKVGVEGYVYFTPTWGQDRATFFQYVSNPRALMFAHYQLSAAEVEEFVELWRSLGSSAVRNHTRLTLALRRFSDAGDRSRPDDRLIDLMIGAEELFLPDSKTELTYKLALRCAFFLGVDAADRRVIFDHMKRAYDARGVIVHGTMLNDVKLPDGSRATLEAFTDATADFMRRALKKAVGVARADGPDSLKDWDSQILTA